jgi:hypothetical protein
MDVNPKNEAWTRFFIQKTSFRSIGTPFEAMRSQPEHAHYRWAAPGIPVKKPAGYLLGQPVRFRMEMGAMCEGSRI